MNEVMDGNEMMQLMQQATMNISSLGEQMGIIKRTVSDVSNRVVAMENRMQGYEDRLRLTRDQARRVNGAIHERVNYLLELKHEGGVVARECLSDDKKYRGKFISRCYHDTRTHSRLGTPYYETFQRDYDEVLEYIKYWEPEVDFEGLSGTEAYKRYLDIRAEEKL